MNPSPTAAGPRVVDSASEAPSYHFRSPQGRYLKLSPSAYHLLTRRQDGASFKELAAVLRTGSGEPLTEEQAEAAYNRLAARIDAIDRQDSLTRSGFWLRWPFLSEAVVVRLAALFARAYRPAPLIASLALLIVTAFSARGQSFKPDFTSASFAIGYGLLLVSVLLHELGHASACARYGARPGAIGCGIYLVYPVFYTDVTSAWELSRWQRVIVDLGGLYFQFVVGALYALAYATWHWEPLKVATLMILGSVIFSLNPIFKFDGYWVISDALGVTNLGRQPRRIGDWLARKARRQPVKPLPWPGWVTAVLAVYSALTFAVWGWFLAHMAPLLRLRILPYPAQLWSFLERLIARPTAIDGKAWGEFLTSTYLFAIAAFLFGRLALALARSLYARIARERRPAAPPASALLAASSASAEK